MATSKTKVITLPDALPVLPLRETVVYPMAVTPILLGHERSIKLVQDVMKGNQLVALVTQRRTTARPAGPDELYRVGTMAIVHQVIELNDSQRIIAQGLDRIQIHEFLRTEPYLVARIEHIPDRVQKTLEIEALIRTARELFVKLVEIIPELSNELVKVSESITEPDQILYFIAASIPLSTDIKQQIFELDPMKAKFGRLVELLQHELSVRQLMQRISTETQEEISKSQREYILREQMKTIQRELGELEPEQTESRQLRERLDNTPLSQEARKEAEQELARLERTPTASPEYGVIRNYLDWMLKLPWGKATREPIDIDLAKKVLDEDHYNLEKIKQRIVEYLAVKRLREERQAELGLAASRTEAPKDYVEDPTKREPILCFIGPPGVGKTSLGQSIARAMRRRFVRISLGGIHDEAEIRGHRRTYIGAMPGRILQALARGESADPVFMLDEVDKLGVGFHGDPSAALLEVLDPAQNYAFVDNYLGVAFDLSGVLFICTANTTDTIPPPLLDRMEVLTLSGYTDVEKLYIVRRYLLPKQLTANGLRDNEVIIEDGTIGRVIREYTREAGVRNLERELSTILRKVALRIGQGANTPVQVRVTQTREYLGPQRFFDEVVERIDRPGVATGLAWTPTGGDILFVEATMMPGTEERLILTGMLGEVMRESAQAALSYLRANAEHLGIDPSAFEHKVVHVHVPAGAIPKDGPSAGVTMLAALASQAVGKPVRNDIAMTGEITLRGKVLPIGGIKEKVLAAHRAGIQRILLPRRNEEALEDVPQEVRDACQFVFVESADDVIAAVLR
jgi:ATP-dependent Lon protease